jgi:ABC-2 type transport system ATP-binding protein
MVARGVTVIVSTSYMDEAERFDRVALLHRGRLLALDTPSTLQAALDNRVLEVRCDRLREAERAAADLPEVERSAVFGDRLHLVVGDAAGQAPAVRRALADAGFSVEEIGAIGASMEDVFIERTAEADRRAEAAGTAAGT